jgi:8-amino-7-oxononanoate synthase
LSRRNICDASNAQPIIAIGTSTIRLIEKLAAMSAYRLPASVRGKATASRLDVAALDGFDEIIAIREAATFLGIPDPFFRVHEGIAGAEAIIGGRAYVNFASYDYLGLNGDPRIAAAAKAAIDRYGSTVSASRLVSGERPIHHDLEQALARLYGVEDCVTLVGGHATNVTVIGALLGSKDAIVHDALAHNSVVQGAMLSGAQRLAFPHLDYTAADRLIRELRPRHRHVLLVIEGHYSMDGDAPDLAAFVEIARLA